MLSVMESWLPVPTSLRVCSGLLFSSSELSKSFIFEDRMALNLDPKAGRCASLIPNASIVYSPKGLEKEGYWTTMLLFEARFGV